MKNLPRPVPCITLIALLLGAALPTRAQELPKSQPKLLTIIREQVKNGHNSAHARNEQGWPAALEKAKHPYYYLAFTSITGPNEAWYVTPYESHAQMGEDFKRADADPVLTAEMDRLSVDDAEHVSATTTLHAISRPELSYGDFPDLAQMRLYEMTFYTVRPGREEEFEAVAKTYAEARKRAGVKTGWRAYMVTAGMPNPTYLVISSVKEFSELDKEMEEHQATMKAATDQEKTKMTFGIKEALVKEESNRFRVDPKQSYISKETRNKDPEFWLPK